MICLLREEVLHLLRYLLNALLRNFDSEASCVDDDTKPSDELRGLPYRLLHVNDETSGLQRCFHELCCSPDCTTRRSPYSVI